MRKERSTRGQQRRLTSLLAALPLCLLSACSPQPYSGTINIVAADTFKERTGLLPTVQLDVIGVNAIELQRWKSYPVSEYWTTENTFRESAPRQSFILTTAQPGPFQIGSWTSERKAWKESGATTLVLIADLPGAWRPRPPGAKGSPPQGVHWYEVKNDPRRLVVPWTQDAYGMFTNQVEIALRPNGMRLQTPVDMSKAVPAAGN